MEEILNNHPIDIQFMVRMPHTNKNYDFIHYLLILYIAILYRKTKAQNVMNMNVYFGITTQGIVVS